MGTGVVDVNHKVMMAYERETQSYNHRASTYGRGTQSYKHETSTYERTPEIYQPPQK